MVKKKSKNRRPYGAHLFLWGGDSEGTNDALGGQDSGTNNSIDGGQKKDSTSGKGSSTSGKGSSGGSGFMSNVSQIAGIAGMFDSIAQNITAARDASRAGVSNQPQVLVEGVLGGQSGSHLANMWNTTAKTNEAINYVNSLTDSQYAVNNSDNLLAQYSDKKLENLNINTKGKELEDFAFDPASWLLTKAFGLRESASKRQNRINEAINAANTRQRVSYENAVNAFRKNQIRNAEMNYRAFGGPIYGYMGDGAIAYDMARDNLMVKMMNAQNRGETQANVPSFAQGGLLSDNFTNGVTTIGAGGSHEKNPYSGVPMGIAEDGQPNLVEEGEAIYNDYVFSNRLRVPKAVRSKYKLRGPKDMTFAEAFLKAQEESEERENDPISKNGLDNIAMILAQTQEEVRSANSRKKAHGGHLYSKGSWWTKPQEVVWEEVEEDPETQSAIDAFWKDKLGDYYYDKAGVRNMYLKNNDPYYNAGEKKPERTASGGIGGINPLRLAPIGGNVEAVITDGLGITNKVTPFNYIPDYREVGFSPLGDYMPEFHTDIRYAANQQAQQAAATRNAIMNTTNPNRFATLLAADYNAQGAYGDLLRDAEIADYENLLKAKTFNRATNQYNSEMGIKTAIDNNQQRLATAQAKLAEAKAEVDESNAAWGARGQNKANLAESIGYLGTEIDARRDRDALIPSLGRGMTLDQIKAWLSPSKQREYALQQGYTEDEIKAAGIKAYGGKLKKKKKGLTY